MTIVFFVDQVYDMSMIDDLRSELASKGFLQLHVKIRPQAEHNRFRSFLVDGTLKIDICAVPEDGKANDTLVTFLVAEFSVVRSAVTVLAGHTSRKKIIRIQP